MADSRRESDNAVEDKDSSKPESEHTSPAEETHEDGPRDDQHDGQRNIPPDGAALEKAESQKSVGPGPPPNGGLQAWLQVASSFVLFFNTFGILNTFGVYQNYYASGQLWQASSSNISWIGSIQALMVLLIGAITGPIFDRGHLRILLVTGTFWIVFGHMMLSLTTTFWQSLLAQGFAVGLGGGCLFIPGIAILPPYFTTKIGLAIGLAASGSSTGGIIYPIMFFKLIPEVGFPWAVRILGFTALATLLVPIFTMKIRVKPPKIRSLIDWDAFTDWPYISFVIGTLIGFIGLYVGIFYISYYGEATGLTDHSLSFYLVPILNAGSVFGRTIPNYISDKIGPLNVLMPSVVIVGIVLFCFLAVTNAAGLVVLTAFFGFFSGVFIALPPVMVVALTKDKSKIGTRIGMAFAMFGIGVLAGGPAAGAILDMGMGLNWTGVWAYGGAASLVCSIIFIALRLAVAGPQVMKKV